jgi:hypothetical protein
MRARREGFFSVGSGFFDAMTWRACPSNAKVDEAQRKSFFRVFWGGVVGWVGDRKKNGEEKFRVDEML